MSIPAFIYKCPRCGQGGLRLVRLLTPSQDEACVCEECDQTWLRPEKVSFDNLRDLDTILAEFGLSGNWTSVETICKGVIWADLAPDYQELLKRENDWQPLTFEDVESLEHYMQTLDFGDGDTPSPEEWRALPYIAKHLHDSLKAIDLDIRASFNDQDCSDYARFGLTPNLLTAPQNPFATVILSRFGRLTTVAFEWDVRPDVLERIKKVIHGQGLHYVTGRLFGDPEHNHWRYAYEWAYHSRQPPPGTCQFQNEEIWMRLFDYY
jgi:hypothetical protein